MPSRRAVVRSRAAPSLAQLDQSLARRRQAVLVAGRIYHFECLDDLDAVIDQTLRKLQTGAQSQAQIAEISPHFGVIWPAAIALARHLATWLQDHPQPDLRLIELGCGLALPSMVAQALGVATVVATDRHGLVPHFLERNTLANGLQPVTFAPLDWRQLNAAPDSPPHAGGYGLVVGSDLLYEPWQPGYLAQAIPLLLATGGTAIIADPGRRHVDAFVALMEAAHFRCELSSVVPIDHGRSRAEVLVLELTRGLAVGGDTADGVAGD